MERPPLTLMEAVLFFSNEQNCHDLLVSVRWPDGIIDCPHCKSERVHWLKNQKRWKCSTNHPRRQFSIRTGTIFEESRLPLSKWFVALWLIVNAKNGISSWEVSRALGITQKSGWFMLQRLRTVLKNTSRRKLKGEVLADETFVGGKFRNMHSDKRYRARQKDNKVIVFGILERGGLVKTVVVPDRKASTLQREVKSGVAVGSNLYTDELTSYQGLRHWYNHGAVNHAEGGYVDGNTTTNDLEAYWSLLKRTIRSTYISVDRDHLKRYLDEQEFRYNTRKITDGERFAIALKQVSKHKRLTYKELTKRSTAKPRRGG